MRVLIRGVLVFSVVLSMIFMYGCRKKYKDISEAEVVEEEPVLPPSVWKGLVFPTAQQGLLDKESEGVFQPTAAGTLISALYGSVRTSNRGGRLRASFHEGVDIAPLKRNQRGEPLDPILAVAAGRVVYICSIAGNSTYGKYIVIEHEDTMGAIFTLYAHLSEVQVKQGDLVMPGTVLGVMGNTATYNIPLSRAHLHFEVGVLLNTRFLQWYNGKKLKPAHDIYHGWNFLGVDPLVFLSMQRENTNLSFADVLDATPIAFELVIRVKELPDYFKRYPTRWQGGELSGSIIAVAFSEGGVPLWGRNATAEECGMLSSKARSAVIKADKEVLGRNGLRLVVPAGSGWSVGQSGEQRLDIMLF